MCLPRGFPALALTRVTTLTSGIVIQPFLVQLNRGPRLRADSNEVEEILRIPLAALAGVTAYVGFSLLEWSTWRRLHRMRRVDATAFLMTALAVLTTDAVMAVAIGCALYKRENNSWEERDDF